MEIQLEFDFFDWEKYQSSRAQMIENNVPPMFGAPILLSNLIEIEEEPQERYSVWLKKMLKEMKNEFS